MFEKMMKISLVVLVFAIALAIVYGLIAQPVAYVPEVLSNDYESFIAPEPGGTALSMMIATIKRWLCADFTTARHIISE